MNYLGTSLRKRPCPEEAPAALGGSNEEIKIACIGNRKRIVSDSLTFTVGGSPQFSLPESPFIG